MIVDFDDFTQSNHRFDLIAELKEVNPAFKVTLFAIPALGTDRFWEGVACDWIELAVHGWTHPDPHECQNWTRARMEKCIAQAPIEFVNGFKAPGWQISDGCYEALLAAGWWVADQHYNDERRPAGLPYHCEGDGDHWHGHIQNVCGNGLEERFGELLERVRDATSFEFVSQAVSVDPHPDYPGARVPAA